jgi:hypothetical protein
MPDGVVNLSFQSVMYTEVCRLLNNTVVIIASSR